MDKLAHNSIAGGFIKLTLRNPNPRCDIIRNAISLRLSYRLAANNFDFEGW